MTNHPDRHGARQPECFDPARAAMLDDPARFEYLPPQELFDLLSAPKGGAVVDFGAGTGTYALRLAQARPDLQVIALDEQPEMLELLRKKLLQTPVPNVCPFLSDKGLGELKGSADRLLALNVLHELGDTALKQAAELLKEGGRAVFVDWNAAIERPVGPPRDHTLTPEAAADRVSQVGLQVLSRRILRYHYALVCGRPF